MSSGAGRPTRSALTFSIPMRGNERGSAAYVKGVGLGFSIPMRGNESPATTVLPPPVESVFDPHEG